MPTFASLSLAGAGGPRLNGGPVGKTERCALVVLITLLAPWGRLYAPAAAMIAAGGLVTAVLRLGAGSAALPAPAAPATSDRPR